MQPSLGRLEQLLESSIQIVDHLEIHASGDNPLQQIKQSLQQQHTALANIQHQTDTEQSRGSIATMRKGVHDIDQMLGDLRDSVVETYNQETGNAKQQFETLPIPEQRNHPQAYHSKVDYKSVVKLQENMDKISSELLDLSGQMEHASLGVHTGATAQVETDNGPTPPTLSP